MKRKKKKILWGIIIGALGLVLLASGLYGLYTTSTTGPPALYVNGIQATTGDFSWATHRGTMVTEPCPVIQMVYGEENTITVSLGDTLEFRNKLPWLGVRQRVQITLYEAEVPYNCCASWPLETCPTITRDYAEPGHLYIMEIYVMYRSLFASGQAIYGMAVNVE